MIIKLSHCRHSISASDGLQLINSLTKGTDVEEKLKNCKLKHARVNSIDNCNRSAGTGYWQGFKRRNAHRVVTKKGEKFELDRQNWTTCSNFKMMH